MKRCLICGETYSSGSTVCQICGFGPVKQSGFTMYAPALAQYGDGFKAEYFKDLDSYE